MLYLQVICQNVADMKFAALQKTELPYKLLAMNVSDILILFKALFGIICVYSIIRQYPIN